MDIQYKFAGFWDARESAYAQSRYPESIVSLVKTDGSLKGGVIQKRGGFEGPGAADWNECDASRVSDETLKELRVQRIQ